MEEDGKLWEKGAEGTRWEGADEEGSFEEEEEGERRWRDVVMEEESSREGAEEGGKPWAEGEEGSWWEGEDEGGRFVEGEGEEGNW